MVFSNLTCEYYFNHKKEVRNHKLYEIKTQSCFTFHKPECDIFLPLVFTFNFSRYLNTFSIPFNYLFFWGDNRLS